jgi:alpha-L-rhamnosidase
MTTRLILLTLYNMVSWGAPRAVAADEPNMTPAPFELRCEYLKDPQGIDVEKPRLSWWLSQSARRGDRQSARQVLVASSPDLLAKDRGDLWDSGKVSLEQSTLVEYAGAPLQSETACHWKVRMWDADGKPSPWSSPAKWSMGLLKPGDWKGQWVGLDRGDGIQDYFGKAQWIWHPEGNAAVSAPAEKRFFRRVIDLPADRRITGASIAMTADDGFTLYINGEEAGRSEGHPNVYSDGVSARLHPGLNVLAVAAYNKPGPPQNPAGLLGSLIITFNAGPPMEIVTDGQWRSSKTADSSWMAATFDESSWLHAAALGKYGMAPWGMISTGTDHRRLPARWLRREFTAVKPVKRAMAYMSGLGFSEMYLNGQKVDNRLMDPTQSRYDRRALYVTFDVTDRLKTGRNAAGVILGNGRFFSPRVVLPAATPTFGFPKLLFQMRIEYTDGASDLIVSDKDWKITDNGPIRANSEFDGEEYDAHLEQPGWDREGFNDSKWLPVQLVEAPKGNLVAQMLEPMRVIETLKPVAVRAVSERTYVADFGQNLYGMVGIKVKGPASTHVTLRTAFDRHPDGTIDMSPNRSALSTDQYILKGGEVETWAPRFRGQGTRYAQITGWPGVPTVDDLELRVVHSDLEQAGDFSCSNELVNKIYANMRRTVRMQERGVPMDPDRDERQAWLSVSEKTSETEGFMYNVAAFYTNFLAETRIDQRADGCLSDAGSFWPWSQSGDPCWPAVVTTTPWSGWLMYGDRRILTDNYSMMKRWVEFLERRVDADFVFRKGNYGDWVDAYSMDGKPDNGATSRPLLWTAYFYYNCKLVAQIADFLGHPDDATHFRATAEKTGAAFHKTFFDPKTNTYESKTQTSYVLPLAFGLVPPGNRQAVIDNLVKDILETHHGHLSVGCVGLKWLMQTLTDIGRTDVAWIILTQTTRPSWGYMISKDGTSIWERWDRDTRDPGMNGQSQTILAGYLGAWMYQALGGINYDPAQPGFKHIILSPRPVGDLKWVNASHRSPFGMIRSYWKIEGPQFHWTITIPPNTTAEVHVPIRPPATITEGGVPAAEAPGIKLLRAEPEESVFSATSGTFVFSAQR